MEFVKQIQDDAEGFNPSSTQQLQQLLFAPFKRIKKNKKEVLDESIQQLDIFPGDEESIGSEVFEVYGEEEPKRKVVRTELDDYPEVRAFTVPNTTVCNFLRCCF